MRDAFGGILNIVLIALFLVIVEGILGFVVNYSKAFKMKNNVISAIEQYEASGCFKETGDSACLNKIVDGAKSIGYSPTSLNCSNSYTNMKGLFCYKPLNVSKKDSYSSKNVRSYRIVTQVDINFPIINKIMSLEFFQVSGDTKVIEHQFGD